MSPSETFRNAVSGGSRDRCARQHVLRRAESRSRLRRPRPPLSQLPSPSSGVDAVSTIRTIDVGLHIRIKRILEMRRCAAQSATRTSCRWWTRATESCCRQSLMISVINYSGVRAFACIFTDDDPVYDAVSVQRCRATLMTFQRSIYSVEIFKVQILGQCSRRKHSIFVDTWISLQHMVG